MSEEAIFAGTLQKPAPTRGAAYPEMAPASDHEVRRRVAALLRAHGESGVVLRSTDARSPIPGPTLDYPAPWRIVVGAGSPIGPEKLREKTCRRGLVVYLAERENPGAP